MTNTEKRNCLYIGKIASFRAPARANKIVKQIMTLSKEFDVKVVTQFEPGINFDEFTIDSLDIVMFAGASQRRLAYKNAGNVVIQPNKLKIITAKFQIGILRILKSFLYPDPYIFSILQMYRASSPKIKTNSDIIITSSYPYSNLLIGLLLKFKRKKLTWIIELRDPFVGNKLAHRNFIFRFLDRKLENLFFTYADKIFTYRGWYPGGLVNLQQSYPKLVDKFVELPYCGYDEELSALTNQKEASKPQKLSIIHAGNFYGGDYSPENLIEAVKNLRDTADLDDDTLLITFYGDIDVRYSAAVRDAGLQRFFEFKGLVPYSQMQTIIQRADVLLWIAGSTTSYADNIPTKVFDYISTEKTIWAIIPPRGLAFDFVKEHAIFNSDTSSVDDIQTSLKALLADFSNSALAPPLLNRNDFSLQNCCSRYLEEVSAL
ncbi:hypothetical protein N9H65_02280 [Planktomarina temperata]|nr:hypothetical protein [Planktomarina temperata]